MDQVAELADHLNSLILKTEELLAKKFKLRAEVEFSCVEYPKASLQFRKIHFDGQDKRKIVVDSPEFPNSNCFVPLTNCSIDTRTRAINLFPALLAACENAENNIINQIEAAIVKVEAFNNSI